MPDSPPELSITASRHMTAWMAREHVSLGFSTYQAGKLFLVGLQPDARLSVFERTFNRCMGLHASPDSQTIWMGSLFQLWRLENYVPAERAADGSLRRALTPDAYDALYVPVAGYTTGDADAHDICIDPSGRPVFVATLFNCLATISESRSFRVLWKPPFISAIVPEDRCHLNGLASDPLTSEPAYVTMVSRSDVHDAWRDRRIGGGLLMDVRTNQIVADALSMPHSPRVHPGFPGRVWLLNAGTGFLGYVDTTSPDRRFVETTFCPGFVRGLTFVGRSALVAMSAPRENRTFQGMPLDANLRSRDTDPRCALHVINLDTGNTDHWLRIEGAVHELYDVIALPTVRRPKLLGFKTDEIRRTLRLED